MKKVDIYTWRTCPFCVSAKSLLDQEDIAYDEHPIDGDRAALEELRAKTGSGSVPQIFVDGEYIGGCDDLHRLYDEDKFEEIFDLG